MSPDLAGRHDLPAAAAQFCARWREPVRDATAVSRALLSGARTLSEVRLRTGLPRRRIRTALMLVDLVLSFVIREGEGVRGDE
jgi:hypothetical protein